MFFGVLLGAGIGIAAGAITCLFTSNLEELDSTDFMYQQ